MHKCPGIASYGTFPISLVLTAPFGHLARFAPSSVGITIAFPICPNCPPAITPSYPTGAGDSTFGGSGGVCQAFPVAAGLVNNSTSPTIARIATIPKSKMFTSFLSAIFASCAYALNMFLLLVFFLGTGIRFARSCPLDSNTLQSLLHSRGNILLVACFRIRLLSRLVPRLRICFDPALRCRLDF